MSRLLTTLALGLGLAVVAVAARAHQAPLSSLLHSKAMRPTDTTIIRLCPDAADYGCSHSNCQLVSVPLGVEFASPSYFPVELYPGTGNITIDLIDAVTQTFTLNASAAHSGYMLDGSGESCTSSRNLQNGTLFWEVVFPLKAPCVANFFNGSLTPNCPTGQSQSDLPWVPNSCFMNRVFAIVKDTWQLTAYEGANCTGPVYQQISGPFNTCYQLPLPGEEDQLVTVTCDFEQIDRQQQQQKEKSIFGKLLQEE